ncbi:MAG: M20/M25/M40 family metallo-hydrolase, partial [Patescibacteria group bacterium]|nr:M20/M25/M40 family metallo-hydrolase [Patescibacteria group bacterium]
VRNHRGKRAHVTFEGRLDYESFRLPDEDPSVLAAETAIRAVGETPERAVSNGGLDANWLTLRGLPTVTLGGGQMHVHTTAERLDLREFDRACQVALVLAGG